MCFKKLILILFFLFPLVTTAEEHGNNALQWKAITHIDVDAMKTDLHNNAGKADEHRKNYDKDPADADLSVDYEDEVWWFSHVPFKVTQIEQLNPPKRTTNPFKKAVNQMTSRKYPNGMYVVQSGPSRTDLNFTGTGKIKGTTTSMNYYKITFDVNGEIVDPHIIIHH